jgi:hypothetical protein
MHRYASESRRDSRQRRGEGLAFTGLHFYQLAMQQCPAAHQLHRVMAQAQTSHRDFLHQGKDTRHHDWHKAFSHQRCAQHFGSLAQPAIAHCRQLWRRRFDLGDNPCRPSPHPRQPRRQSAVASGQRAVEPVGIDLPALGVWTQRPVIGAE